MELPPQWKIHDVFHADLLTPYHETKLHGANFVRPPPDLINGEEEYKIEEVLQSRKFGRECKVQYLVKWKGYPDSENQWVDWDDLHADKALVDFKKKNPDAASHIKAGVERTEDSITNNSMSDNDHSSPLLAAILGANLPPEVRQLFLKWQPTVPSSWTTPPESEGEDTTISTGSSPICQDYYQPQTLIPTNLSLRAAHTPYTTDHTLPHNSDHSSEDSFPCPMPEITNTTPSPDPIPILPRPLLEGKHSLGLIPSHSGSQDPRSPLQIGRTSLPSQEAQALHGDTRGMSPPGADDVTGTTDKWEKADLGITWEDYGPRPQVLPGYMLNEGTDYVPFDIRLPSGELKPAKYIKLEYGEDPLIYSMIDGDPHQYIESFQVTPFPSTRLLCTYTSNQLEFFEDNHDLCPEINSAVFHLFDKSAMAKVECYWINKKKLKWEYEELQQVQHDIWKWKLTLGGCARRIAGACIYQCIMLVNRSKMWALMDEYKACHHGRRS